MPTPADNPAPQSVFPCQQELLALFGTLINVMFCMKDLEGRYVEVNSAFVRRTGKASKRDVIGTVSADHFVPELACRFDDQDQQVFATGEALHDQLELIKRPNGELGWYLTTKIPVSDPADRQLLVGLVSVSRDLHAPSDESIAVEQLQNVVTYVRDNLGEAIRVASLANAANCSEAQLERRMRKVFGLSATQYVLRVRVDRAAELLVESETAIATIAANCGFYDQPDFTRRFARLTNATPAQFRGARRR